MLRMPTPPERGRQAGRVSRLFGIVWMVAGVGIAIAAATGKIASGLAGDASLPYVIAAVVVAYGLFRYLYGSRNQ